MRRKIPCETHCTITIFTPSAVDEVTPSAEELKNRLSFIGQSIVRKVSSAEKDIRAELITQEDLNNTVIYEYFENSTVTSIDSCTINFVR